MGKKHNKHEEFSYEDRLDMLFGSDEPTQQPKKEEPKTLRDAFIQSVTDTVEDDDRDYEEQSPLSVTEPMDIDEARSIMSVFGLAPEKLEEESVDTVDDVLGQLNQNTETVAAKPADTVRIDPTPTPVVNVENSVKTIDDAPNPWENVIQFKFNSKTHVATYTDGVRTYTVPIDFLKFLKVPKDCNHPTAENLQLEMDILIYTSVPTAVFSEIAFNAEYRMIFKFDADSNYRFGTIEGTGLTFCYAISPEFKREFMKAYDYAKSCGKAWEFCNAMSLLAADCTTPRNYIEHILDMDTLTERSVSDDLAQYGHTTELFREIVKNDDSLKELEEADYSQIFNRFNAILVDLEEFVYLDADDDDSDEEDEDDDEFEDDDVSEKPEVLPSDDNENRAILGAFGKKVDETPDENDDDDDDISKFLKDDDDDDGDDGESFILNVKE